MPKIKKDEALRFYFPWPTPRGRCQWLEIRPGIDDGDIGEVWCQNVAAAEAEGDGDGGWYLLIGGARKDEEYILGVDVLEEEGRQNLLDIVECMTGLKESDGWQEHMPKPEKSKVSKLHIVVEASGGVVNDVHCSMPGATCDIIDWDNLKEEQPTKAHAEKEADRIRSYAPHTATMVDV